MLQHFWGYELRIQLMNSDRYRTKGMAVWHGEDRKLCANLGGYQNMYELPENIVACLLRDRWAQHRDVLYTTHDRACPWLRRTEVVINEKLKTSGGLTGQVLTSKWQHTYIPNNTYIHTYMHAYIHTYIHTNPYIPKNTYIPYF